MLVFSLIFLVPLALSWRRLAQARTANWLRGASRTTIPKTAYLSVGLIVAAVVMRSWTILASWHTIPFYYIDYEKGDPLYAGTLVSVFLLGGVVGTLVGSPLADRWGYKRYLILSMALTTVLLP